MNYTHVKKDKECICSCDVSFLKTNYDRVELRYKDETKQLVEWLVSDFKMKQLKYHKFSFVTFYFSIVDKDCLLFCLLFNKKNLVKKKDRYEEKLIIQDLGRIFNL